MEDVIENIIKNWLEKEFKNAEAIPGLLVKGLAKEISEHRYDIHSLVEREWKLDDIESIELAQKVELTDDEKERVLHRYEKYDDDALETLSCIIEEIVDEREEADDSE